MEYDDYAEVDQLQEASTSDLLLILSSISLASTDSSDSDTAPAVSVEAAVVAVEYCELCLIEPRPRGALE